MHEEQNDTDNAGMMDGTGNGGYADGNADPPPRIHECSICGRAGPCGDEVGTEYGCWFIMMRGWCFDHGWNGDRP